MKKLNRKKAHLTDHRPERILQFGGGNFLRGFVDWMIDVLNKENIFNGSVVVVKPTASGDYDDLKVQDGLFHVILDGIKNGEFISRIDLVESVSRTIHPYKNWSEYLATARDSGFRYIVSNTTEAGIAFSEEDLFDNNPPGEFPAKLTRWLYERYQYFSGSVNRGCLILPCELIEQNGDALREAVLQYANYWNLDRKFQEWVMKSNYFYNTLVDRIVSGYPDARADEIKKSIGYDDALLVAGEYYHSWVISGDPIIQKELRFSETDLNVQFVDNISDYRELKVRILNGAHTSLVPVGYLAGYRTVDGCMKNDSLVQFLQNLLKEEVKLTLDFLPAGEVDEFIKTVIDRFKNPVLAHRLQDISLNSFAKFKARLLPTIKDYIVKSGDIPRHIAFALACLILFYHGEFQGEKIPLNDETRNIDFARETWKAYVAGKIGLLTLVTQFLSKLGIDRETPLYERICSLVSENIVNIRRDGVLDSLPV